VKRAARPSWRAAFAAGIIAALGAALALTGPEGTDRAAAQAEPPTPNVVVIMTDDQDLESMRVMDQVAGKLAERGTTFANAYATTPLCCPSRATFLTGEYAHNHGVVDDGGGYALFQDAETALPVELRQAGYRTGLIGKYLNGYRPEHPVPPGWDVWRAAVNRATTSYDYDLMNASGRTAHYGSTPGDYRTDVYADKAVKFLEQSHELGQPFFLTVTPGAPHEEHGPPIAAPRHEGAFETEPLPRPPSFNEKDLSDKPEFVQNYPLIGARRQAELTALYRGRLESLLAVDELLGRVVGTLRRTEELDDTVVVFTSDNGFMLGQHRLVRKLWLYEESARVPLIIRGPGFPAGQREQVVGNLDLAPTILDLADAEAIGEVDGTSLLPLAEDPAFDADRAIVLENFSDRRKGTEAVVTRRQNAELAYERFMYAEHSSGRRELYDLARDPYQLESRHRDPAYADRRAELGARLAALRDCTGESCRAP
jgi:arylsulfatase A-like enzyme